MDNIPSYFERLLWLIYRVFFVFLIPCVFIAVSYIIVDYLCYKGYIDKFDISYFFEKFRNLSSFNKIVLVLGFSLIINIFVEAFAEYFLILDDAVELEIEKDSFYKKFQKNIQAKIKEKYKAEYDITASEISYLMRFKLMEKYSSFNNYYWYLYMNYKLSVNLAAYSLLAISIYLPLYLIILNNVIFIEKIILSITQLLLTSIHIFCFRKFMDKLPEYGYSRHMLESKKVGDLISESDMRKMEINTGLNRRNNLKILYLILIAISIVLMCIYTLSPNNLLLIFAFNTAFYPIFCLLLRFSYHYRSIAKSVAVDAYVSLAEQDERKNELSEPAKQPMG